MSIILEPEFNVLKQELKDIQSLVGHESPKKLEQRKQKLLDRLEESRKARIKRAGLRLV